VGSGESRRAHPLRRSSAGARHRLFAGPVREGFQRRTPDRQEM